MSVQDYELLLRVRADLNQALGGLDNLKRKLGDGEKAADKVAKSGDKATTAMRSLGTALAAVGIAKLVKDYFSAADAASNMAAKVRLVTDSTEEQAAAQKKLFTIAQQTRADLGTTTELYVKLAQSSDVLRKNQELLFGTTKLVNEALVLSGADAGTASGVVRQFAQAMASGVLRGDEFNSIMEGAPRLAKAMADGLGVPVGALRAMAAQGKLTADQVIKALEDQGATVDREFTSMPITVGGAMQKVRNSLLSMVGAADQNAGASRDVANAIDDLATTLSSDEVQQGFTTMIKGLVSVASAAAQALAKVSDFTKFVGEEIARSQGNFAVDDTAGIQARLDKVNAELKSRATVAGTIANTYRRAFKIVSNPLGSVVDAETETMATSTKRLKEQKAALEDLLRVGKSYTTEATKPKPANNDLPTVTVHPDAPKPVDPAAAKEAAAAAAAAAKAAEDARQNQIQSLIALQGALDPTAKIWADYNTEVEKQNKLAAAQKAVAGADVDAIEARRNAIIALAATARDNSLAELAKKDQDAWEQLRESLRTPSEVKLESAIEQIKQLNESLAKGIINADQYASSMRRIGTNAVIAAPQYQGVDATVGGAAGELSKNFEAGDKLEKWHQQQLQANEAFRAADIANEKAYQAQKAEIERQYAEQSASIAKARQSLSFAVASEGFANLADLAKSAYGEQSKQYRALFALSKGFAVAQAAVSLATNISKASEAGFPLNIGFIVGAIAQGAQIAAILAGASFNGGGGGGGYSGGGYTGPGAVNQPAGVVHAGEVVWSQRDIARAGGVGVVEAMRRGYRGYADGGVVSPVLQLPTDAGAAPGNAPAANKMRVYVLQNEDQLAQRLASHPAMEKAVIAIAGENGTAITAEW